MTTFTNMAECEISGAWEYEADVVIVGSGFAGLAAAIEARLAGASVVVLEKMKGYGGNSIISDGCMAACGTPEQEEAGIEDSPDLMYSDMVTAGLGLNHPRLVRLVAEQSCEAYRWTVDYLKVRYQDRIDQFGGHSVRRCYTTHNRSGSALIVKMAGKLKELGGEIRTRVALERILRDETGRTIGVQVLEGYSYPEDKESRRTRIKARMAVVLATGGFANDLAFRLTQDPRLDASIDSTNKICTTAEGLIEALRIGATPVHLSWIQLGPWASPDEKMYGAGPDFASYIAFPFGLMVDPSTGRRFVSELADRKMRADAILRLGHPAVALADREGTAMAAESIDHCLKKGVVRQFDAIEELAHYYGLPPAAFKDTVDRYNGFVEKGKDEEFGKTILPGAKPIVHPPFFGIRLWPKIHHTMGGVMINEKAQVIDLDQQPIPGLYAAGEVTGGVHGASRLGSCAITDCLVFGRIAGRNAAA